MDLTPQEKDAAKTLDRITALYLAASAILVCWWNARIPHAGWFIFVYLASAVAAWRLPPLLRRSRNPLLRFLGDWYPILCFTACYLATASLNKGSPFPPLDPWLIHMERQLFGSLVCDRFSSAFSQPLFAEAMAFFYFSYYLMIPGLGLILWWRRRSLFHEFVLVTACTFYVYYLVFSVWPC
ncbi:MAG: hypothetical protein KJ645_14480, partial [Planctomycetes bacterium]|nr:hypothetical protein [Planctomycetota bacterium]